MKGFLTVLAILVIDTLFILFWWALGRLFIAAWKEGDNERRSEK